MVRGFLLAEDRDFRKAEAACWAAAEHRDGRVHWDARQRFLVPQPPAVLPKVVWPQEPRQLAEPVRLLVAQAELPAG